MRWSLAALQRPSISRAVTGRLVPNVAVPALPGAMKISSTRRLWRNFQAVACSRAPLPTRSTRAPIRTSLQLWWLGLLPFDGSWRLARDVVDNAVDAVDFVDNPVRHPGEQFMRQAGPVGR